MFAKLDEFGILDVIASGWWLLEQKSSTWFRNRTKARAAGSRCVCGCQLSGSSAALQSSLQPGLCCMPRVQARHYLTYYVLRALEHTSSVLRAHKEIACKLSEKFHHTEHRAAWASTTATARTTIWWRFFHSRITSKFARMTSRARQHEPCIDTLGVCRSEHSNQCFDWSCGVTGSCHVTLNSNIAVCKH